MSGVKLIHSIEAWVEVQAECAACGSGLLSESNDNTWQGLGPSSGKRIVVKVRSCARCAREAAEQINAACVHREG